MRLSVAMFRVFSVSILAANVAISQAPSGAPTPALTTAHQVKSLHITILSTMLADEGIGEWGFAALVDAHGRRILYDTGNRPETVLNNARELGIDLSTVTDVVLSHHHGDHTGGVLTLRRELAKVNPAALSRVHVAPGIFLSRRGEPGAVHRIERVPTVPDQEANPTIAMRPRIEATGAVIIEHAQPAELMPGVWLTGPVPHRFPERNWSRGISIVTRDGLVPDSVPEDMALVINTKKGLVVVTGCGHAGIVNIVTYAREVVAPSPAYAVVGGLHLFAAPDETLAWDGGTPSGRGPSVPAWCALHRRRGRFPNATARRARPSVRGGRSGGQLVRPGSGDRSFSPRSVNAPPNKRAGGGQETARSQLMRSVMRPLEASGVSIPASRCRFEADQP